MGVIEEREQIEGKGRDALFLTASLLLFALASSLGKSHFLSLGLHFSNAK